MYKYTRGASISVVIVVAIILAASFCLAAAKQGGSAQGTTADFARAYPFVMLAIVVFLLVVIGYLLKERDGAAKDKAGENTRKWEDVDKKFDKANEKLEEAIKKADALINTLFERDREIENSLAETKTAIAAMAATCKTNRDHCHEWRASIETSVDRRDGPGRREYDKKLKDDGES